MGYEMRNYRDIEQSEKTDRNSSELARRISESETKIVELGFGSSTVLWLVIPKETIEAITHMRDQIQANKK
jgi:hypothetical protein